MTEDHADLAEPGLGLRTLRMAVRCLPRGRSWAIRRGLPHVAPGHPVRGDFHDPRISFAADMNQPVARTLFFHGYWEQNVTSVLLHVLRKGQTVIDVGAHIGYWTLLMSQAVGQEGRVLSFEADPTTFGELTGNVRLNGCQNTMLLALAVADASERRRFYTKSITHSDVASLITTEMTAPSIEICTIALDEFLDESGIGCVDLVKLDIEGGEMYALQGLAAGIQSRRYKRILLELHPAQIATAGLTSRELLNMFSDSGYRCFRIANYRPGVLGRYSLKFRKDLLVPDDDGDWAEEWPHYFLIAPDLEDEFVAHRGN